jgi:hypothetical protein
MRPSTPRPINTMLFLSPSSCFHLPPRPTTLYRSRSRSVVSLISRPHAKQKQASSSKLKPPQPFRARPRIIAFRFGFAPDHQQTIPHKDVKPRCRRQLGASSRSPFSVGSQSLRREHTPGTGHPGFHTRPVTSGPI